MCGSYRQIERVRYYSGGPAFPTLGLLGGIRVPTLQMPRVWSLVRGGRKRRGDGRDGNRDNGDIEDIGDNEDHDDHDDHEDNEDHEDHEDHEDDTLQEMVRNELSDFDRRLEGKRPNADK